MSNFKQLYVFHHSQLSYESLGSLSRKGAFCCGWCSRYRASYRRGVPRITAAAEFGISDDIEANSANEGKLAKGRQGWMDISKNAEWFNSSTYQSSSCVQVLPKGTKWKQAKLPCFIVHSFAAQSREEFWISDSVKLSTLAATDGFTSSMVQWSLFLCLIMESPSHRISSKLEQGAPRGVIAPSVHRSSPQLMQCTYALCESLQLTLSS